jgi:hypothetical protein
MEEAAVATRTDIADPYRHDTCNHNGPQPSPGARWRSERGQTLPLLMLFVWLAAGAGLLLVVTGQRATDRARAQTAADAAALAGAVEPGTAGTVAGANGSSLVSTREDGTTVIVEVANGTTASAIAAATQPPPALRGLDPRLAAAIATAEAHLGEPVPIVSGFRSYDEQLWLWEHRDENPYPVAAPGTSEHERGLAIDVPLAFAGRLRSVGPAVGLCQPLPATDPVHFRLCVARSTR